MQASTERILVVSPSWIGDAVLSQPLLHRLAQQSPSTPIDVFAPKWAVAVYRRMAEVADTLENPFSHGQLAVIQRRKLGHTLRERGYQQAYLLPNSFKSALVPWFANIPVRVGYSGEMRFGLLTDRRKLDKDALPLMVERFAWLAQPPGMPLQRPLPQPNLRVDDGEFDAVCQRLNLEPTQPIASFCPGAEYGPAKRWLPAHFAELANQLRQRGYAVWSIGSASDKTAGDDIARLSGGHVTNLCGRTTLDEAIVLLSGAQLVVTNDSGLMHVAAALNRRTIAIYGSSSPAFTPPLSDRARVAKLDLDCSPCFARTCPLEHFNCMTRMKPALILEHIDAIERSAPRAEHA